MAGTRIGGPPAHLLCKGQKILVPSGSICPFTHGGCSLSGVASRLPGDGDSQLHREGTQLLPIRISDGDAHFQVSPASLFFNAALLDFTNQQLRAFVHGEIPQLPPSTSTRRLTSVSSTTRTWGLWFKSLFPWIWRRPIASECHG